LVIGNIYVFSKQRQVPALQLVVYKISGITTASVRPCTRRRYSRETRLCSWSIQAPYNDSVAPFVLRYGGCTPPAAVATLVGHDTRQSTYLIYPQEAPRQGSTTYTTVAISAEMSINADCLGFILDSREIWLDLQSANMTVIWLKLCTAFRPRTAFSPH